jgi:hypothetical protein
MTPIHRTPLHDVSEQPPPLPDDPAPEEVPGNPEENPVGIPPKAHDRTRNPGHSHS